MVAVTIGWQSNGIFERLISSWPAGAKSRWTHVAVHVPMRGRNFFGNLVMSVPAPHNM